MASVVPSPSPTIVRRSVAPSLTLSSDRRLSLLMSCAEHDEHGRPVASLTHLGWIWSSSAHIGIGSLMISIFVVEAVADMMLKVKLLDKRGLGVK